MVRSCRDHRCNDLMSQTTSDGGRTDGVARIHRIYSILNDGTPWVVSIGRIDHSVRTNQSTMTDNAGQSSPVGSCRNK